MPKQKDRVVIDTNLWISFLLTKDNFLLSLALDGFATHLLTGDKDLLILKNFGQTKIQKITEYLGEE